jgi:heme exporter protein C
MWKYLYQLASPKGFYQLSDRLLQPLGYCALILTMVGFTWGLLFAPADYQQGDAFRIIYIHVPSAFLSLSLYAFLGFLALLLLVWRIKLAGVLIAPVAQTGGIMAFIALLTGSLWGKPMWGSWWVWDARLTSELILFFLYAAILLTHNLYASKNQNDKIIAILILVGLIDLPIIHYSVNWWNTLHQGSSLSLFAKPKIHSSMLYPLLINILGFSFYSIYAIFSKARVNLLIRERRQKWVSILLKRSTNEANN